MDVDANESKSDTPDFPPDTPQIAETEPHGGNRTTTIAQVFAVARRNRPGSTQRRKSSTRGTPNETPTPPPLLPAEATARIIEPRGDSLPQRTQPQRHPIFHRLRSMFHIVRGTPAPLLPPTPSIDKVCHYHQTYGSRARKCRPPCSYAGICHYCGQYGVPDRTPKTFCPHGIPIQDNGRNGRGTKFPQ